MKMKLQTLTIFAILISSVATINEASASPQQSFLVKGNGIACIPEGDCYKASIQLTFYVTSINGTIVGGIGTGEMFTLHNPGHAPIFFRDIEWSFNRKTHFLLINSETKGLDLEGELAPKNKNTYTGELTGNIGPIVLSFDMVMKGLDKQ